MPFLDNGLTVSELNSFSFTTSYSASGSTWEVDSFPENSVFQAELNYTDLTNTSESFSIRVGKGGNIYSFRGAFGESVPPQWRNPNWVQPSYGGGTSYAPWVDEVWQMVAVDGALNNPPDSSYFIHQAGVYLKTPAQTQPFYSPLVAEYFSEGGRSYSVVNWGQQAHTEDLLNTGFTSSLLYYTRYTVIGDGILQVDNMMYNFGDDNINFINVPWGGVRNSSLDNFFISDPASNYSLETGLYGQTPVIQTASTGGWVAWSNDALGAAPALGMAHPTSTTTNGNVFRYGDAGDLSNPNNLRDYHVFEMIRFPSTEQLSFGTALSFRFFYVLGENVDSVKSTIVSHGLVEASFDSDLTPLKMDVDTIGYNVHTNGSNYFVATTNLEDGLVLRATPYLNSYPLFLITSAGMQFITSDPYHYSSEVYDGITENLELLGFLDNQSRVAVMYDTICSGDSYTFPDGSTEAAINADQTYISTFNSFQTGWDSIVFTHLSVIQLNTDLVQAGNNLESEEAGGLYQWLDCDESFATIPSEISQSFTAVASGNYAMEISDGECIDTSACISVILVGLLPKEQSHNIRCYPNPSSGNLTIDLDVVRSEALVIISDSRGKELLTRQLYKKRKVDLFIPGASGVYTIQVVIDGAKTTQLQFVKE